MDDGTFPPSLADIPVTAQATEQFGWALGTSAVLAAAIVALFVWVDHVKPGGTPPNWNVVVACGIASPLLAAWDVQRRRKRMTLVVRSGQVGVYRQGKFSFSLRVGELTHVLGRGRRLAKPLAACFLLAVMGLMVVLLGGKAWPIGLGFFAFTGAYTWSILRTGLQLLMFKVPQGGRIEEVLLERVAAGRLFGTLG